MAALSVVQVLPALEGGGVERGTLEIAQALVAAGHRSIVLSAGGRLVSELEQAGSEHYSWPLGAKSLRTLAQIYPLRRWLATQKVDILHLRSRLPAWVTWLAWRGLAPEQRPRLVTTVHGLYSVSRYSEIMTCGERVIAVSETVRDYLTQHYPRLSPDKIRVIYRGIDPQQFPYGFQPSAEWYRAWYSRYPQLQGQRVLTLPGRLTRLKGHLDFIQLIAQLRARAWPVHGLIVGGQDPRRLAYAAELQQRVAELELQAHITFTGQRADMREIYASSDLVLSLSTQAESFGRTVLEALALGVPVLGYAHGGVGELLQRLFPAGAVPLAQRAQLTTWVDAWLQQPQRPQPFDQFRLAAMQAQTLALYHELHSAPL